MDKSEINIRSGKVRFNRVRWVMIEHTSSPKCYMKTFRCPNHHQWNFIYPFSKLKNICQHYSFVVWQSTLTLVGYHQGHHQRNQNESNMLSFSLPRPHSKYVELQVRFKRLSYAEISRVEFSCVELSYVWFRWAEMSHVGLVEFSWFS